MSECLTREPHLERAEDVSNLKRCGRWYLDWRLYLILLVSGFLHFFLLQTTEFDADQANLFQLAHDTVAHGLLPLSSNLASINILNPPFFVYMLVPAAALSDNPLGGAITVALLSVATALLVYLFTRRYFGWLPALVAALLSTSAFNPLKYSRSIWQPDILPFFMILFLCAIFRGAVERKKGWFFPAVALIAIIYQLHASAVVALCGLLVITVVLAPETIRWRDIGLAALSAFLLFLPYLALEKWTHFADLQGVLAFARLPSQNDSDALLRYQSLLVLYQGYHPRIMDGIYRCLQVLFYGGVAVVCLRLFFPAQPTRVRAVEEAPRSDAGKVAGSVFSLWNAFRLNPQRVAFLLLLLWQVLPFINLIHHSVALHLQYFLLFLPGPFIFVGLAFDVLVSSGRWLAARLRPALHIGIGMLCVVLVLGQLVSATAYQLSLASPALKDRGAQGLPYVNDLGSIWDAVQRASQLAQARHISRLFISVDTTNIRPALSYMGGIVKTPTTVFGYTSCLVLPAPGAGPALYLLGPYADKTDALLHRFASATLIDQPHRIGQKPFRLYLVQPLAVAQPALPAQNFVKGLTLLDRQAQVVQDGQGRTEITRWGIQRQAAIAPGTFYNYQLTLTSTAGATIATSSCLLTSLERNDQLVMTFQLPANHLLAPAQEVKGQAYDTVPDLYPLGSLTFTSFSTSTVHTLYFDTIRGAFAMPLSVKSVP